MTRSFAVRYAKACIPLAHFDHAMPRGVVTVNTPKAIRHRWNPRELYVFMKHPARSSA